MAKKRYTPEQIDEFIELAQEIGLGPAMRELKYPGSYHTAQKWFAERGLETPDTDALFKKAAELKKFYSDSELMIAAQSSLHRVFEMIETTDINAEDLNKLVNAMQKAVQTIHLIQGKSTNISETQTKTAQDLEIQKLLNQMPDKTNENSPGN